MQVVILAGGLGTRLKEETEFRPKPMVMIGDMPIIWHIMKNFSMQGHKDFIIALGYKGGMIVDFFSNLAGIKTDSLELDMKETEFIVEDDWHVKLIDTGLDTFTGGRIKQLENVIGDEDFICTYGDGLSDVNVTELIAFHNQNGKIATVTAAHPISRFGLLEIDLDGLVQDFREKSIESSWVNAGFFVLSNRLFPYITADEPFESAPLSNLVQQQQLVAWLHTGSWKPMDTHREKIELEEIWKAGNAFWKNW